MNFDEYKEELIENAKEMSIMLINGVMATFLVAILVFTVGAAVYSILKVFPIFDGSNCTQIQQ